MKKAQFTKEQVTRLLIYAFLQKGSYDPSKEILKRAERICIGFRGSLSFSEKEIRGDSRN